MIETGGLVLSCVERGRISVAASRCFFMCVLFLFLTTTTPLYPFIHRLIWLPSPALLAFAACRGVELGIFSIADDRNKKIVFKKKNPPHPPSSFSIYNFLFKEQRRKKTVSDACPFPLSIVHDSISVRLRLRKTRPHDAAHHYTVLPRSRVFPIYGPRDRWRRERSGDATFGALATPLLTRPPRSTSGSIRGIIPRNAERERGANIR